MARGRKRRRSSRKRVRAFGSAPKREYKDPGLPVADTSPLQAMSIDFGRHMADADEAIDKGECKRAVGRLLQAAVLGGHIECGLWAHGSGEVQQIKKRTDVMYQTLTNVMKKLKGKCVL